MSMKPSREAVEAIVRMALLEDAPWGDLTSQTLIPADASVTASRSHFIVFILAEAGPEVQRFNAS